MKPLLSYFYHFIMHSLNYTKKPRGETEGTVLAVTPSGTIDLLETEGTVLAVTPSGTIDLLIPVDRSICLLQLMRSVKRLSSSMLRFISD